ncbi:MAG: hypothetical protein HW387_1432 [Parachlamydiales bacterium]|nr:hypothetical protein [Parachlamydiales bacterium]
MTTKLNPIGPYSVAPPSAYKTANGVSFTVGTAALAITVLKVTIVTTGILCILCGSGLLILIPTAMMGIYLLKERAISDSKNIPEDIKNLYVKIINKEFVLLTFRQQQLLELFYPGIIEQWYNQTYRDESTGSTSTPQESYRLPPNDILGTKPWILNRRLAKHQIPCQQT